MKSTLSEIKVLVDQLASKIDAPQNQLPTYGYSKDGGLPHIEIDKEGTVHYVAIERGSETFRYNPINMDDLLYEIFKGVVWSMGSKHELKNRIKGQDHRRMSFAEQERLIGILKNDWQLRLNKKHNEILIKYPFDDYASERVDYYVELKSTGKNHDDAWALACEKYLLPHGSQ